MTHAEGSPVSRLAAVLVVRLGLSLEQSIALAEVPGMTEARALAIVLGPEAGTARGRRLHLPSPVTSRN